VVRTLASDRDFSLFLKSRPSLGPAQPTVESIPEFFPGVQWPGSEVDLCLLVPTSRISGGILLVSLYAFMTRARQLYYVLGRSECSGNTDVYKTVSLAVGAFALHPRPGTLALGLQHSRQLESSSAQMCLFIVRCFVDTGGGGGGC